MMVDRLQRLLSTLSFEERVRFMVRYAHAFRRSTVRIDDGKGVKYLRLPKKPLLRGTD